MRVTDLTKQHAILRNLQTNSERLQNLQENMASGRRINRLSDDPIGATQVQDFRTKLSFFGMLRDNMQQNFVWLDRTEQELAHVSELLRKAKTLILAQANDSSDASSRKVTAEELEAIADSLFKSGNSKIGKVHIFAGSKTLTPPLQENTAMHPAEVSTENVEQDLKFLLDPEQFAAEFDGFSQRPYLVRIAKEGPIGRAHYVVSDDGGETWSEPKTLHPQVEAVNEAGLPSEKVMLRLRGQQRDKLGEPVIFPEGLEWRFEPNPPVEYRGNDDKRLVPVGEGALQPVNVTAREVFYQDAADEDTVNIFDLLHSLVRSLRDNDRIPLEQYLTDLDEAYEQVLNHRADVGSIRREMEDQLKQISDREFNNTKQMSEIEDLDFPAAVTEMNLADVRHRATLDTSGRLIQPSLLNFLR